MQGRGGVAAKILLYCSACVPFRYLLANRTMEAVEQAPAVDFAQNREAEAGAQLDTLTRFEGIVNVAHPEWLLVSSAEFHGTRLPPGTSVKDRYSESLFSKLQTYMQNKLQEHRGGHPFPGPWRYGEILARGPLGEKVWCELTFEIQQESQDEVLVKMKMVELCRSTRQARSSADSSGGPRSFAPSLRSVAEEPGEPEQELADEDALGREEVHAADSRVSL